MNSAIKRFSCYPEDSDEEEEDGDDDENEKDEEGEGEKESGPKSYFLRKNKPRTQLYNAPIEGLYFAYFTGISLSGK